MPIRSLPIQTSRLQLDALRADDAQALFACRGDPEVARYQGWRPEDVEAAAAFIERQKQQPFGAAGSWCQLAIRTRAGGELIGDLGIHFPSAHDESVELGISLARSCQGQGYARETMRVVIDQVFGAWSYRRIVGSVDPRNTASVALLRSLGFRQEAHHVESLHFHGEWVDDLVFALLAREWTGSAVVSSG